MNVLTIIDSFKGTITSKRLGEIAKEELERKGHNVDIIPVADGGDGFCDAIEDILIAKKTKYKIRKVKVNNPLFKKIDSYYLIDSDNKIAYIELAKASGINLLSRDELDPFKTSTYGFGELINDAIRQDIKRIVLGIGGSATDDGGTGLLEALGLKFYNQDEEELKNMNNEKAGLISHIDDELLREKLKEIEVVVLSDVTNSLLGDSGATYVFSPQKGARTEDLKTLENNIINFSNFNKTHINDSGAGAAGGVGYALLTYLNAKLYSGIDYILDLVDYDNLIKKYDVIVTGEGKIDSQSLGGKVVFRISNRSDNKKVIVVCAINELKNIDLKLYNVDEIYSVVGEEYSINDSMNHPEECYRETVKRIKI